MLSIFIWAHASHIGRSLSRIQYLQWETFIVHFSSLYTKHHTFYLYVCFVYNNASSYRTTATATTTRTATLVATIILLLFLSIYRATMIWESAKIINIECVSGWVFIWNSVLSQREHTFHIHICAKFLHFFSAWKSIKTFIKIPFHFSHGKMN